MTSFTFLILCLASYRITHLLVFDKIFEPIRELFVVRDYEEMEFTLQGGPVRRFIGQILNCFWCAGVWVSAFVVGLFYLFPSVSQWIYLSLATAAVQSLIEQVWTKAVGFPEMRPAPEKVLFFGDFDELHEWKPWVHKSTKKDGEQDEVPTP